jgi:hypothetical protein
MKPLLALSRNVRLTNDGALSAAYPVASLPWHSAQYFWYSGPASSVCSRGWRPAEAPALLLLGVRFAACLADPLAAALGVLVAGVDAERSHAAQTARQTQGRR